MLQNILCQFMHVYRQITNQIDGNLTPIEYSWLLKYQFRGSNEEYEDLYKICKEI